MQLSDTPNTACTQLRNHRGIKSPRRNVRSIEGAEIGPPPDFPASATLDSATPPRSDRRGHHRGFRYRRGSRCDGLSHHRGFRDWMADDSGSSYTCSSEWHLSGSFGRKLFIGLDGGDDRLNRNPSVGDQLSTRTPGR